jgi:FlaA1/EpsC-like NDP-sugar epimerase
MATLPFILVPGRCHNGGIVDKKKIVVTGAAGLIGSAVIRHQSDYTIIVRV